ncbi:5-hydroxy-benzimidazole O-methyltransferase BzaC [Eubacterium sp. 1001713B170207_170306_E7]|uniref:5-hydroxy-benzimidazole O-methyltransferase BzaC n=1 Tax=Eubacterium sp. 1001713B170207_170306_E7 TaxID=2787097 RepID=UPI001896AE25|nr:5-hydroxy-benzimidazole O-methyltransferase BzaC [Eubacterium sp. 1001713B170207_170306_E7]
MGLLKWDPNTSGGQYLEDLSTAYWYSESLFAALDMGLFELLEKSSVSLPELAEALSCDESSLSRYLHLLKTLDLVDRYENKWSNTTLSSTYLIKGKPLYQGNSILWRREIRADWDTLKPALEAGRRVHFPSGDVSEAEMDARREEYITAMDNIVKLKAPEVLEFFGNGVQPGARILDVGAGSGAFALGFLEKFEDTRATLVDIRQVLPQTQKLVEKSGLRDKSRVLFHEQNILEPDWQLEGSYDLIILSNIVHAYAEEEISCILKTVSGLLSEEGILLIHDFFLDHWDIKAAFSDINMFINTYNGRVFESKWVDQTLKNYRLSTTGLIPLQTDTAVIFAARAQDTLDRLTITPVQKILQPIKAIGFDKVIPYNPRDVVVAPFAKNKCKFGCRSWDKKHCSTNQEMSADETRAFVNSFSKALLLKSEPPTGDFQRKALRAETLAFKAGYYKAFVFWAGPCSICPDCDLTAPCNNRAHSRPSMEGSGIDVFATVKKAGESLKTLSERGEVIKYYALLLLE